MLKTLKFASVLFLCVYSWQAAANGTNVMDASEAMRIVKEYKILRNMCSGAKGDARKACFSELREKNPAYRRAKKILANNEAFTDIRTVNSNG